MLPTGYEWLIIIGVVFMRIILPLAVLAAAVALIVRAVRGRHPGAGASDCEQRPEGGQGDAAATPGVPRATADAGVSPDERERLERELAAQGLTERERIIVLGVLAGKTHAKIAEELYLSRSTVGTYCSRAYEKLGVASREGLIRLLRPE